MTIIPACSITEARFATLLQQYTDVVESVASEGSSKKKFLELDRYRYIEAPELCGASDSAKLDLTGLTKLVEWKLMHGKFRPNLLKLAKSNGAESVEDITYSAFESHANSTPLRVVLKSLCELRGIGPATASLLLSVYDPKKVLFFSDECYQWLVDEQQAIKYTPKEYEVLQSNAETLMTRLGAPAMDVEKVAFVMMRRGWQGSINSEAEQAVARTLVTNTEPVAGKPRDSSSSAKDENPAQRTRKRGWVDDKDEAAVKTHDFTTRAKKTRKVARRS